MNIMIIGLVHMYIGTTGDILELPFPHMACLMGTSIAGIGIDFTLIANLNLIRV